MRRNMIPALALSVTLAATAHASGVSLRWDACFSDGGVANKTFACDSNTGSERLVMSFMLDDTKTGVSGFEPRLIIIASTATYPSWWQFKNAGTCRQTSLSMSVLPPPASVNCLDWATGNAVGGIGAYSTGTFGPNSALLDAAIAVTASALATIDASQEYFIGSLAINPAKTVGVGACGGCDLPVCIVFDRLKLSTQVATNDLTLRDPVFVPDGGFARWQNGHEANVQFVSCGGTNINCHHEFSCVLSPTDTRGSTWGQVKSLYR